VQVTFTVPQQTLERLEWPRVLTSLRERLRTPRGAAWLDAAGPDGAGPGASIFAATAAGVRERLAETGEALALLEAGERPPVGGASDVDAALRRARKAGVLDPVDLLAVASTLGALHETARFLERRADAAPRLADLAAPIGDHAVLRADLDASLDPSGEVRDTASGALADARREARRLAGEIQQRLDRVLRDPAVRDSLSDHYYTLRNDRYVLPVRADARGGVRGIVHDASRSGTTLFVEPEALVELNNRHKQAELTVEQETRRVLRELSQAVSDAADAIDAGIDALARIDLAVARALLARDLEAVQPEVGDAGVIRLSQLRHPLLPPGESVPNDLRLGEGFHVLVISGPNAGGKTVAMKAVALAVLCVRAGLFVPCAGPARVDLFDAVLADIGDEQDIREHLSTFSAHMANLARILSAATPRSLVVLDEVGVGTDPGEGAAIAQAVLEALADAGARVIATTHYGLLKEMAEVDARFANACVEFDPETLAPTYRLHMGLAGASSASTVAARMGLPPALLDRAHALLSREDRQLDRMLSELAASRATLEREQREAHRLRAESEGVRAEYGRRLEQLRTRRDALYRSMRQELDGAFREAHADVARVVRELQRGGGAREAARARETLLELESTTREAEASSGLDTTASPALAPIDWNRARPGDPVVLRGGGSGLLAALPDRRGRVVVRQGSARVVVPLERVGAPPSQGHAAALRSGAGDALRPAGPARVRSPGPPRRSPRPRDVRGARAARDPPRHRHRRAAPRGARAPGRLPLRGALRPRRQR
jgi:DNA mismatch repair protein MutS2